MKKSMYAIWDHKAKYYLEPFFLVNDDVAVRTARRIILDSEEIRRNPADFTMFKLAEMDDEIGVTDTEVKPIIDFKSIPAVEEQPEYMHPSEFGKKAQEAQS